jgi:hypothetical protein
MRKIHFSLLFTLFAAATASASPLTLEASLVTARAACIQGINRAQVVSNADNRATYRWTITNGVITEGQGTPFVVFLPVDGHIVKLTVAIDWMGSSATLQTSIPVYGPPTILQEPRNVTLLPGGSTTLQVTASNDALDYEWFEGVSGDTSKLVAVGTTAFVTPALTKSTAYWVRVSGGCSSVASRTIVVSVATKRRAAAR